MMLGFPNTIVYRHGNDNPADALSTIHSINEPASINSSFWTISSLNVDFLDTLKLEN